MNAKWFDIFLSDGALNLSSKILEYLHLLPVVLHLIIFIKYAYSALIEKTLEIQNSCIGAQGAFSAFWVRVKTDTLGRPLFNFLELHIRHPTPRILKGLKTLLFYARSPKRYILVAF